MTLASSLTISTCARQGYELGLITPSLNILSTLSWINNRSSRLKCRDLVVMGLTPAVRLGNKLTSWVSATDTAQVSSCETTISWRLPPNSKWRVGADFGNQGQEWRRSRSLGEHLISSMHTCYLPQQYQLDKIPTTSPSLKSMSFEIDAQRNIKLNWVCYKSFPSESTQLKLFHRQLRE